jgi:transposase-like protein
MSENSTPVPATPGEPAPEVLPATPEEKAQWVKRFVESGLSIRKFSKVHDLPLMSLWRWVKRAREQAVPSGECAPTQFTELKLPALHSGWAVELTLPNGTVLRMTKDTPPAMVEQLLRLC